MLSKLDTCILEFDKFLRVVCPNWKTEPHHPSPANSCPESNLSGLDLHQSSGMMRVNLAGEVAAQGLYRGQLMLARQPQVHEELWQAAEEEMDHYAWCLQGLADLNVEPSIFNPIWYAGAFCLGLFAALLGDQLSLGFIIATEEQVGRHLASHLQHLPANDLKNRAIVLQMYHDEIEHAAEAEKNGGQRLPRFVQALMHEMAQVMIKASRLG